MLQDRSLVKIADNSGGIIGRVFKILGGSKKRYAELGDELVISIQTAQPRKMVKKKEVHRAVVVRQAKPYRRKDGSYVRFDENAVVLIAGTGKEPKEPKANRVFGPIPRELAERGYQKIASLAPEVV
jgi:large subunit ribosomal protein L14